MDKHEMYYRIGLYLGGAKRALRGHALNVRTRSLDVVHYLQDVEDKHVKIRCHTKMSLFDMYAFQISKKELADFLYDYGVRPQGNYMPDIPKKYYPDLLAGIFDIQGSYFFDEHGVKLMALWFRTYHLFKRDIVRMIEEIVGEEIVNVNMERLQIGNRRAIRKLMRVLYKDRPSRNILLQEQATMI